MSVTPELLEAYADGELGADEAHAVEAALARDPALQARLNAMRAVGDRLQAHFAEQAKEPLPEHWQAMIAAAASEGDKVVSVDAARNARRLPLWGAGMAIAASLVLGVALGTQLGGSGPLEIGNGRIAASAQLAAALDTQLAADQEGAEISMLASFERDGGGYCRVFSSPDYAGLACREPDAWRIERLVPGTPSATGQYQQAGSPLAGLLAEAQDMSTGEALDTEGEAAAQAKGWR